VAAYARYCRGRNVLDGKANDLANACVFASSHFRARFLRDIPAMITFHIILLHATDLSSCTGVAAAFGSRFLRVARRRWTRL
jgi:hypothetical protein